jgi:uncharacterized protein with NRDE domain
VLCRSCFQIKGVPAGVAAAANLDSPGAQVAAASAALDEALAKGSESAAELPVRTTMEMIAESPTAIVADSEGAGPQVQEMLVGEAGQA